MFAGSFFLHACQKNIDVFVPDPGQLNGPDTSWQATITASMPVSVLKSNLLVAPYRDTINVNGSVASVATPFGIQVNFPANCCVGSAGAVTGKVDVEIQLARKKGDMIRLDKPSITNDTMMITAGEIFISLKKEGQTLQLAPGTRININYTDAPTVAQMKFFMGDESNAQAFNWLPTPEPSLDTIIIAQQTTYQVYTKRLRWISIAQPFEVNTSVKVNVAANMASYFTNANTVAYTVFKDLRSVVAMRPDVSTRKFITGKLPVGKAITVVVISKQGDDYYLGFESAVTQNPSSNPAQQVRIVPIKRSMAEILAYLNTL